jgi:hypothetical protein
MAVALAQPHRRGAEDPKDPLLESPLGRLILDFELDRTAFDNGLAYGSLVRRVFSARGVPLPVHTGRLSFDAKDLSAEAAHHLRGIVEALDKRLRKVSLSGLGALRELVVYEREAPQTVQAAAVLRELAS